MTHLSQGYSHNHEIRFQSAGKKSHFSQKVPFCKFTYSAVYLITKQTAQAFVHRVCGASTGNAIYALSVNIAHLVGT